MIKKLTLAIILISLHMSFKALATCSFHEVAKTLKLNKQIATSQAGSINDFEDRIDGLLNLYHDSDNKFLFPLIALHGAKWAHNYLSKVDMALFMVNYGHGKILFRKKIKNLKKMANTLKEINRKVFIDIVSKYRTFLDAPNCYTEFVQLGIPRDLILQLKEMSTKEILTKKEKLKLYIAVLKYEQKHNVAPEIKRLETSLNLSILDKAIFLRPKVRFSYFPRSVKFHFKNFFDTEERIKYAIKAAEIALEVGEEKVIQSIEFKPFN